MYQIDDYVMHLSCGICRITEIGPYEIPGFDKNRKYYYLLPINGKGGKVYVPLDNDAQIRKVYTKDEALKLINDVPKIEELVVESDKVRELRYKEVIRSSDPYALVKILKSLYVRRCKRLEEGKKTTATDDKYFKMAEENLFSELAFVLNMNKEDMSEYVFGQLDPILK